MLPLSVVRSLVETVSPDGTSAIADAAAAAWQIPAGQARHVRTSAAHVFAVSERGAYLRLAPVSSRPVPHATAVAQASVALADRGAPVARPLPGRDGLVTVVDSPAGPLHACLIDAVRGPCYELADLSPEQVNQWGRAVAEMHEAGTGVARHVLPRWTDLIADAVTALPDQASLAASAAEVCDQLMGFLGPPDLLGHGDPQPDNLGWAPGGPVFFDLDDASASWAIADLTMAIRDVQPIDQLDRPATSTAVGRILLQGYREVRQLDPAVELAVPWLQRGQALLTYGRLRAALDATDGDEPSWVAALRHKLQLIATGLEHALTRAARPPL